MLEDLTQRIVCARRSTASKALRGLAGVGNELQIAQSNLVLTQLGSAQEQSPVPVRAVQGFVLHRPRRNCARRKEVLRIQGHNECCVPIWWSNTWSTWKDVSSFPFLSCWTTFILTLRRSPLPNRMVPSFTAARNNASSMKA